VTVNPLAARAFGTQAEAYERGRPGWPAGKIAELIERWGAREVVDLAAGTGKLTRILVEHAEVTAIEPVDGMRAVLERVVPRARVRAGTAEAIPLPDASVDAVFVAEAFHWFDGERAPVEIARVLRPGGHLAVLFNRPGWDQEPAWMKELVETVMAHRLPTAQTLHEEPWHEAIEAAFGDVRAEEAMHEHVTDRERLVTEISSFSSIGGLPPDRFDAALDAFREVLERHGIDRVTLPLRTRILIAQKRAGESRGSAG
jgi:ubiquinone/menaquinone biosynthesis C-methylase UbiE